MPSDTDLEIGKNLRAARLAMGYSLNELSRRAKVSKAYLSQMENNRQKQPSAGIVLRLARALQINITDLLGVPDGVHQDEPAQGSLSLNNHRAAPTETATNFFGPLPVPLQIFWAENPQVPVDDIKMLANINYRGWRPATPTDYWFLYQAIKAAAKPYSAQE